MFGSRGLYVMTNGTLSSFILFQLFHYGFPSWHLTGFIDGVIYAPFCISSFT